MIYYGCNVLGIRAFSQKKILTYRYFCISTKVLYLLSGIYVNFVYLFMCLILRINSLKCMLKATEQVYKINKIIIYMFLNIDN